MTLIVGGCSFSSAFQLPREISWPQLLAKQLNTTLIDQARTQGSNWRIWRTLTKHILDGDISSSDTVVVQYTEPHRQEVWSPVAPTDRDPYNHEPFDGGKLFRFKYGSHMYGVGLEKPLSDLLLKCSNEKYEIERFRVQHNLFCGFLKSQGFDNVYFLDTVYSPFQDYPETVVAGYPIINGRGLLKDHLPDDPWHLSELGHRRAADLVYRFIHA